MPSLRPQTRMMRADRRRARRLTAGTGCFKHRNGPFRDAERAVLKHRKALLRNTLKASAL